MEGEWERMRKRDRGMEVNSEPREPELKWNERRKTTVSHDGCASAAR